MGHFWGLTLYVICCVLLFQLISRWRYRRLLYRNGCQPPRRYPRKELFFGLDVLYETGKLFGENRFFPVMFQRYDKYGPTFELKNPSGSTICSCQPENLESVFAKNVSNWTVSYRLPALLPYEGRGFLTTDGAEWAHWRALVNPSFSRVSASAKSNLEHHLKAMISRIPRDGSTVDLQMLLYHLVSNSHLSSFTCIQWQD